MGHVLAISATRFSVATECPALQANGSVTDPPRFEYDVLAGSCTCEDAVPCAHLFAGIIWAQMDALDRAYRGTHENVCRKRWCAGKRNPWGLLCDRHGLELRRHLDREELAELRGWGALVDLDAIVEKCRRGDGEAA
jgi:hypothetical protein